MQIVLSRIDTDFKIARQGRIDLGEAHKYKPIPKPVALMWLNDGNEEDVAKAKIYANTEGYCVFCYSGESDPLGKAKADVLLVKLGSWKEEHGQTE